MISTVTSSVSTIVSGSAGGLIAGLGLAGIFTLISTLFVKELTAEQNLKLALFGQNLDIVIQPLLFVFAFIVFAKVWEIVF